MRTHATVKGFCLCHILCVWRVIGRLGIYLGFYNLTWTKEARFVRGELFYVQMMTLMYMISSLGYLWLSQGWVYDGLLFLVFVPLYVYFVVLRQHLVSLLNACSQTHGTLHRVLGTWMCVPLWRECGLTLMLSAEVLGLFVWQFHVYYNYQACFIAGTSLIYYMHLLFLGNYLIWLASIYRALNTFLQQHMRSSRLGILRTVLREQVSLWCLHWRIMRYLALHLLSFLGLIAYRFGKLLPDWRASDQLNMDRILASHLLLLLLTFLTLMLCSYDVQLQHWQFHDNYRRMEDRLEYFKLRSWCLLRNQTLPMPFGLPIQRICIKPQHKRDIISMLVCCCPDLCTSWLNLILFLQFFSNLPVTQLRRCVPLPLAILGVGAKHLQLTLPILLRTFVRVGCQFLLCLYLYSRQHPAMQINFYDSYTKGNFDINVTNTISQIYRSYQLDEIE